MPTIPPAPTTTTTRQATPVTQQAAPPATASGPATPPAGDQFGAKTPSYAAVGVPEPKAPVRQDGPRDCGEAAVCTIVQQLGGKAAGTDPAKLQRELRQHFDLNNDGTTPTEMVDMLAHVGMSATRGASSFDQFAVDDALKTGGRVLVLADSAKIRAEGGDPNKTDAAHWVVLDGKDAQGNYTVSDPSDGSRYSASLNQVFQAMNSSWIAHQGGGMLVVQPAAAGKTEQDLIADGVNHSDVLGNEPGIGSHGTRFGQEGN